MNNSSTEAGLKKNYCILIQLLSCFKDTLTLSTGMVFYAVTLKLYMDKPGEGEMVHIVQRNIDALLKRHKQEDKKRSFEEKLADGVTRFTGSMLFVYMHLAMFSVWIFWNLGWLGLKPFDASFVVLAMFASVEAIFLSTFVLISQNRMNEQADKRADLDLQVSLLTEHEVTRLINLVTIMAKKMDIQEAYNPEIDELLKDVQPEKVMDTMEGLKKHSEKKA